MPEWAVINLIVLDVLFVIGAVGSPLGWWRR